MREIYSIKKIHIEDQIMMLEKVRNEENAKVVDKELEFQNWRLGLLNKYNEMTNEQLREVQAEFKKKMPEELWEIRKTPPLGFLGEADKRNIVELALVEILLGEY